MSRYTRTVLSLIVADAVLVLLLTFGAVFPSRLAIPPAGEAMPHEFYDYTAKISPFDVPSEPQKRAKTKVPVISARSLPLLSRLTVEPERSAYPEPAAEHTMWAAGPSAVFDTP